LNSDRHREILYILVQARISLLDRDESEKLVDYPEESKLIG